MLRISCCLQSTTNVITPPPPTSFMHQRTSFCLSYDHMLRISVLFAINNKRHYPPHPPTSFTHQRTSFCLSYVENIVLFAINNERHYPPHPLYVPKNIFFNHMLRTWCCLQSTTNVITPPPPTSFTHQRTSFCLSYVKNIVLFAINNERHYHIIYAAKNIILFIIC